ncbi:hypothetical protein BJV74DRAFT_145698 [Russula compacta]|nr:hypothetical protein BJV74DRAFT_145698 [Russula compacta]
MRRCPNCPGGRACRECADGWQEDAKGVLEFISSFSQIVASFIIASYTMLSPGSGGPSPSIICVYIMWLLSLLLSLISALFSTLTQAWARRYIQLPQYSSPSRNRAHTRLPLFPAFMHRAVAMTVTIMHLSVFLFLVGLVIFFFTINKIVAIIVTVIVGLFGVVYLTLTIHGCIDRNFPYRTPLALSGV